MCKVLRAVESPLCGYNDLQGGFEELWSIVAQGQEKNRRSLRGIGRGVLNPREGAKILTFVFRPDSGVHLAPTSPKLVEG
jgi:hypothetical protein